MEKLERIRLFAKDGYEIKDAIQIIQYLDGWVVLCRDGSLYSNVELGND